MTRYRFSWRGLDKIPPHALQYIMTSFATAGGWHKKRTQHWILICNVFFVWNDGNSQNQTFTTGRLFQRAYQIIHKINLNIRNIFVSHLQCFFSEWAYGIFGTRGWLLHVQCEKEMTRLQIRIHCYSNNLCNYIKTHGLISTQLRSDVEQKVFSLCTKLRLCPLCDISTIDQLLFRGWGPPLRGGIVIWLARPFGPSNLDSMLSGQPQHKQSTHAWVELVPGSPQGHRMEGLWAFDN